MNETGPVSQLGDDVADLYALGVCTDNPPRDPCPTCGGDGDVVVHFVYGAQVQDCPDCFGSGVER